MDATQAPAPTRSASFDVAAMVLANALLAAGPLFVRLSDTGPVASAFWRMGLALPVLALAARVVAPSVRMDRALALVLLGSGLFFAADLASWHLGIVRTKLANATLFGNAASFIYPLYGFIVARAWPSRRQGAALGLAGAGAALLLGRSYELSPANFVGDLFCILAGVFYAVYFVMIAKARASLAPVPLLAASTLASAIPLLAIAMLMGERILPTDWTPLIALALCSQVLGQGLMVYVLGRLSPLVIGIGLLVQPMVAAVLGWVIYDERLTLPDLAGAALIAVAMVLVRDTRR